MHSRKPITLLCKAAALAAFVLNALPAAAAEKTKPQQWPQLMAVGDRSTIAPAPDEDKICFAMYTTQNGVLKLSAQLNPLTDDDPHTVSLHILRDGQWKKIADAEVHKIGWTAPFRVEDWDESTAVAYRVTHPQGSRFEGTIRKDPADKNIVVAAVFTGNSPGPGGGKISKRDVVESVLRLDPDVLFFTGDQVYPHTAHTQYWLEFGELFKDLMKDRPTVCMPDDHDVGQPNLWGQAGRKADLDTKGGYTRPAEYVKMVEGQQTSHLPDPVDPRPIEQGIGVWFTRMNVGGIDFAILEDRKFKSGCFFLGVKEKGLGPRPDHIMTDKYHPKDFDKPGLKLLGDRQHAFLKQWAEDWDGVTMKTAVSQTVFGMLSTHGGQRNGRYYADFDANGWPQSARDEAIAALRKCAAFHLCGDQHLSTFGRYGIEEFGDAGYWFCVPSIANLYPRWWAPPYDAVREVGECPLGYCGDYLDGFGNKVTVLAHTNPRPSGRQPAELHDRMPGFGIARFNKETREITCECWPRMVDVTDDKNQYTGWPRTISQFDNFGAAAKGETTTVDLSDKPDAVVKAFDKKSGELLFVVRAKGTSLELPIAEDKVRIEIE